LTVIRECIVTTADAAGKVHIAPLGLIAEGDAWIVAPFRPSTTLDNLRAAPFAVANYTDDVRVFAGCLTGLRDWPTIASGQVPVPRLAASLAHAELAVESVQEEEQRPRFRCRVVAEASHGPFRGFSRAKAAVVEAAILVSRLHMLSREKVEREIAYLEIAVSKTAGPEEREAWSWLMARVASHYAAARP
jgi:hypothetical protein